MKWSFLIGILLSVIVIIFSLAFNDLYLGVKISGIVSAICIILAGIMSGSFASGDRIRASYSNESNKDKTMRAKYSRILLVFAIPNIIVLIVCFFIINNKI